MIGSLLKVLTVALLALATPSVSGVTLEQLRDDARLTPQRFAGYFANFAFKFHEEVQDPDTFLATQSGDCDDFATLAAAVLAEKGYTTHLIAVRVGNETHVVCYVDETKSYLDYNDRKCLFRTTYSNGSIADIARKVAKSFDARWTSAAEITFDHGVKHLVATVHPDGTVTPAPVLVASAAKSKIKVDF